MLKGMAIGVLSLAAAVSPIAFSSVAQASVPSGTNLLFVCNDTGTSYYGSTGTVFDIAAQSGPAYSGKTVVSSGDCVDTGIPAVGGNTYLVSIDKPQAACGGEGPMWGRCNEDHEGQAAGRLVVAQGANRMHYPVTGAAQSINVYVPAAPTAAGPIYVYLEPIA